MLSAILFVLIHHIEKISSSGTTLIDKKINVSLDFYPLTRIYFYSNIIYNTENRTGQVYHLSSTYTIIVLIDFINLHGQKIIL